MQPNAHTQRPPVVALGIRFTGVDTSASWVRFQLILLVIAAAIDVLERAAGASFSLTSVLIHCLIIGNIALLVLLAAQPWLTRRPFPWNWLALLALLCLTGIAGSYLADAVSFFATPHPGARLSDSLGGDLGFGTLMTLVIGIFSFSFTRVQARLEARNHELQEQVQLGQVERAAREAELDQAHEIQMHLLPRETPQLQGFQIACAWQPAQAVSGDYFDVFPLDADRMALCIADVSGKGMSAALLMANLQASVRAFARQANGPADLCAKLNQALCSNIAPGKFVTLFYAILDRATSRITYENAGHCLPLLVHGDENIEFPASYSGVLGVFSHWVYQEHEIPLSPGDTLLLVTDGVIEAENPDEEEFGYQRLIDLVQKERRNGAHALRQQILAAVTDFCRGSFRDDASLIVVEVR